MYFSRYSQFNHILSVRIAWNYSSKLFPAQCVSFSSKVKQIQKITESVRTKNLTFDPEQQLKGLKKMRITDYLKSQITSNQSVRSSGNLALRINLMQDLKLDEDAVIEMLTKDPALVYKCYKTCKSDLKRNSVHRIHYLCQRLRISHKEMCSKLDKYKFVLSLSFKNIKRIIEVLIEHDVTPGDILSDFWILRCKADTVARRLQQVKLAEVDNVRPWMGRCKHLIFEGFINRVSSKQKLLGELSLEEYISRRLGCSPVMIKEIIDREPQLQRTSVLKIKKILDFLLSSGFSPEHIISGLPRVANRRIETIHARLQELNQVGLQPSLYVVCKSTREYQYYINKRNKVEAHQC